MTRSNRSESKRGRQSTSARHSRRAATRAPFTTCGANRGDGVVPVEAPSSASSEGYGRLLYAALLGYLVFGEVPAAVTWLSGAIIIASTLYIAIRDVGLSCVGRS